MPMHHAWRNFIGQVNTALNGMSYYYYEEQRTSESCQAVVVFIIPVLINLLQLKYQGEIRSPFETHPKSMRASVVSLILYSLAYYAGLRSCLGPTYAWIPPFGMVLFGSFSVVSLASILLSDSLGPFLYLVYILLLTGVAPSLTVMNVMIDTMNIKDVY